MGWGLGLTVLFFFFLQEIIFKTLQNTYFLLQFSVAQTAKSCD